MAQQNETIHCGSMEIQRKKHGGIVYEFNSENTNITVRHFHCSAYDTTKCPGRIHLVKRGIGDEIGADIVIKAAHTCTLSTADKQVGRSPKPPTTILQTKNFYDIFVVGNFCFFTVIFKMPATNSTLSADKSATSKATSPARGGSKVLRDDEIGHYRTLSTRLETDC